MSILVEYKCLRTDELSTDMFDSLVNNYNIVFDKKLINTQLRAKYSNSILGFSFHSCMITTTGDIVGACSIIPFNYSYYDSSIIVGLVVDVFILEGFRQDPFSLKKMYDLTKSQLNASSVSAIVAVPNDTVYKYWKKIVRWKDIGEIRYFSLPVNIDRVLGIENIVLRRFGRLGSNLFVFLGLFISWTCQKWVKSTRSIKLEIKNRPQFEAQRYILGQKHKLMKCGAELKYLTYDEDNVKVTYLIDYLSRGGNRDAYTLFRSVKWLTNNVKTDLILRIGTVAEGLIGIPKKKEPKSLRLCGEVLNESIISIKDFYDISHWDFGLLNYDVR